MFAALVTDGHKTGLLKGTAPVNFKAYILESGAGSWEKANSAVKRFFYSGSYVHETLSFSSKNLWNKQNQSSSASSSLKIFKNTLMNQGPLDYCIGVWTLVHWLTAHHSHTEKNYIYPPTFYTKSIIVGLLI